MWAFVKHIGTFLTLAKALLGVVRTVLDMLARHRVEKKNKEIEEAAEAVKQTNEIKDDEERVNAKADALCKLEKLGNPASDCDKPAAD